MDPSSLALRFNEVSAALRPLGHRIVVRRARELLGQGRFDDSVLFLSESARRLSIRELAGLATDVRSWIHARGDIDDLLDEQSWIVGSEIDDLMSTAIVDEYQQHWKLGLPANLVNRDLHVTAPVPASAAALIPPIPPAAKDGDIPERPQRPDPPQSQVLPMIVPEVVHAETHNGLPTGPLVAGIIMLLVLTSWFCLFWPI